MPPQLCAERRVGDDEDIVDGFYLNSPSQVRRKTEFALSAGLGGVFIWEAGQDATSASSGTGCASLIAEVRC